MPELNLGCTELVSYGSLLMKVLNELKTELRTTRRTGCTIQVAFQFLRLPVSETSWCKLFQQLSDFGSWWSLLLGLQSYIC